MYYEYQDRSRQEPESNHLQINAAGFQESAKGEAAGAPKNNRRRAAKKIIAVALACVLAGGAGGTAFYFASGIAGASGGTTEILKSSRVVTQQVKNAGEKLTLSDIYAKYAASTVGISTEITTTNIFGEPTSAAAAGSGFFITSDGYILTNYHVVSDASNINVTCYDGTEYTAKYVGGDEDNDIAVLKIDATGITPVVIGSSDVLLVGEGVAAIGNPLGELTFTLTAGIVSALNRSITTSDGTIFNMIQTDCAVNRGNSGGPLFNTYGEVVGIVSAKYSSTGVEGLSFAIPINRVIDLVADIMEHGYVTGKPYMGITVATVSSVDAKRYNLVEGVYVNSVAAGSCAEKAGLKQGDIITAMDDVKVTSQGELIALKNTHRAGDTVELTVVRAGKTIKMKLTFDEQTPEAEAANTVPPSQSGSNPQYNWREYFMNPWGSQYGTNGGPIY